MSKRAKPVKRSKPKKIARNPMARALAGDLFRKRVVKSVAVYKRRPKHPKPVPESD